MTVMFKPPLGESFGWRDLLRIGPEEDPFWQRVRRRQMRFIERYRPVNLLVALFTGLLLLTIPVRLSPAVCTVWLIAQMLLAGAAVLAWRRRKTDDSEGLSRLSMQLTFGRLLFSGLAWGLLYGHLLANANASTSMLMATVVIVGIGCHAYTTAPWPLGSIAITGLMTTGAIGGLFASHWQDIVPLMVVFGGYMLFISHNNLMSARTLLSRMGMQEQMHQQKEVVRLLLNEFEANGTEWLYEFDATGRLTFASNRFAEALRRPVEEVVGQHWTSFISDRTAGTELFDIVRRGLPYRNLLLKVEVEGEVRWWSLSGTPKIDRDGEAIGYRGVGCDVTDRQRAAERIAELATFDALTGLVNRRIIHQSLAEGLLEDTRTALLFVDLDRFKAVNDSLGHGSGDRLLSEVAQRLRAVVAERGGDGAMVGRLGGDEFAIVVRSADQAQVERLGASAISNLSRPYLLGDKPVQIGASIGLAIGPEDGATVEAVMRAADLALYDAKEKGRGRVRRYDRQLHQQSEDRRSLELDLRSALGGKQLRLAFQPVVDAADERIVAFEALLRWSHPTLGEISPATFIPLAEESGQISRIGAWVLNEACRVAAGWPRHVQLAVNVSPLQFDDPGFVQLIRETLRRWNIAPERLELELTESLFLDERAKTSGMLAELEAMGVGFALDDFGTGYSSLGYLQKIAFRRIKIDRSFVRRSASDGGESIAIIQAIVALADKLGMETTAEGTETRAEFETMRRLGCAQIQGYYFGKPMPADEVSRLIDRSRPTVELVSK